MNAELDKLEAAQRRLDAFVEGKLVLDPNSSYYPNNWHIKRRKEEIERYGAESVMHLIPLLVTYHTRVVDIFSIANIHTRQDIAKLLNEEISGLGRRKGAFRYSETLTLIEIIRDKAAAELNQG